MYKVLRGGYWYNYSSGFLRSANRGGVYPDDLTDVIGFRVVEDLLD
ncbi:hypothetical protein HZB07_00080 [Candidatus Saganbacteria bacterium]|nr:hypothetical protein [Candidatus Saganbacteria bacterium]